jgi:uncharacterized damage-inducible protein DinB
MEMTKYLIDTFNYNSYANKKVLEKIKQLPDTSEAMRFMNHLVNCQYKWMARIMHKPKESSMSWWEPVYSIENWTAEWDKSLKLWIDYLSKKTDDEIGQFVIYTGTDGGQWSAKPQDIALQLNYHSIHHRAQIQTLIRQQGLEPDFVDYIGIVYKKLS